MIIVTGGAGFIGSCLVKTLNNLGEENILIIDNLGNDEKWKNCRKLRFRKIIQVKEFEDIIKNKSLKEKIKVIFHLGANSSTTEKDADSLIKNNTEFTKKLILFSINNNIKLIYASSASVYGAGNLSYDDSDEITPKLIPLNMYGFSKKLVDEWVIKNKLTNNVVGLRFFNVYGPNEYHKGEQQSIAKKGFDQIKKHGKMFLFKSYNPSYKDGEFKRDFIYVKDAVDVILFFWKNQKLNGIFNVGSGCARSWNDLAKSIFTALELKPKILYKEMPEEIRNHYQYFTEAKIDKLRKAGYKKQFFSLEDGISDYVKNYLMNEDQYF
jgi:ADP-L-glycero-D-manno-heptose 6-epimerase